MNGGARASPNGPMSPGLYREEYKHTEDVDLFSQAGGSRKVGKSEGCIAAISPAAQECCLCLCSSSDAISPRCGERRFAKAQPVCSLRNNTKNDAIVDTPSDADVKYQIVMKKKVIAYYLPQFHPIPENNDWWEKGFTEWTNVTKALPLYKGHAQPFLPSELGFYDLRLRESREEQAKLAIEYGVDAFCYYHYWFGNGKVILEKPFNDVLTSGQPALPFMLCWANGTWSGIWHGLENRILIKQEYPGADDAEAHFLSLVRAFRDPRYIKFEGKPVFLVHRPTDIPMVTSMMELWRKLAIREGLVGLYLLAEHDDPEWQASEYGFDAFVNMRALPRRPTHVTWKNPVKKIYSFYKKIAQHPHIIKYEEIRKYFVPSKAAANAMPCIIPGWDNTPRSSVRGVVIEGLTPAYFSEQVSSAIERVAKNEGVPSYIFIKSWNEWAEGNVLEPSRIHGRAYLEALRKHIKT